MRKFLILTTKEVKDIFTSPIGYIAVSTFLVVVGIIFSLNVFVDSQANMQTVFQLSPVVLIIFAAAVTMRSWSEERKEGTLELVITQPISNLQLLAAKLTASYIVLFLSILLTAPIPIALNLLGNPDNGVLIASYIGLLVVAATYNTVGQLVSINTNNQIVAFILSVLVITGLYVLGDPQMLRYLPESSHSVFAALGISPHFQAIIKGVFDTRDILYFITVNLFGIAFIYNSLYRITLQGK
jgi:ABC-2 type transport system permease protein